MRLKKYIYKEEMIVHQIIKLMPNNIAASIIQNVDNGEFVKLLNYQYNGPRTNASN